MSEEINEKEIEIFHGWIEDMCDPDLRLSSSHSRTFAVNCARKHRRRGCDKCCGKLVSCTQSLERIISSDRRGPISRRSSRCRSLRRSQSRLRSVSKSPGPEENVDRVGSPILLEANYKQASAIPHGLFRKLDENGDVAIFACFVNGHQHGPVWKGTIGGGFMVSFSVDFTSNETIYLYPDCRTALVGTFHRGQMVEAFAGEVVGVRGFCSKYCGMLWPFIGRIDKSQPFSYGPATSTVLTPTPFQRDPYEKHFVFVAESKVADHHAREDGVFALADILDGTVVAFYNGVKRKIDEEAQRREREDDGSYRLQFDGKVDLDIPEVYTSTSRYTATLGHKINHSFDPNCELDFFDHPRFGLIYCIASVRDIFRGEELTINYGYHLAFAPTWYKKLWIKHQKQKRNIPDW